MTCDPTHRWSAMFSGFSGLRSRFDRLQWVAGMRWHRPNRPAEARFLSSASGLASVEFALLSTVLLIMVAGGFDLVYMINARRDADRASMLLARILVTCADTSCSLLTIDQYYKRRANILVRYPTAEVGAAMIQRTSGAIKICGGNMTYLESDVSTTALNVMKDSDVGAAVYVKSYYKSIMPSFVTGYIASAGNTYRNYTVDVRDNGNPCV